MLQMPQVHFQLLSSEPQVGSLGISQAAGAMQSMATKWLDGACMAVTFDAAGLPSLLVVFALGR